MIENYKSHFELKSKHIFVPSEECVRKGQILIAYIGRCVTFPEFFFHYRSGGHVATLHEHLRRRFFFRIDIKNFYYAISRSRVTAALRDIGFKNARLFAKWSCVKNPFGASPSYSLPIGFVQSPALASLAMASSPLLRAFEEVQAEGIFCSVYFDDFICSADDFERLEHAYDRILKGCEEANMPINPAKLVIPASEIVAFNCKLKHGIAEVTGERISAFFDVPHSPASEAAFARYCETVASQNTSTAKTGVPAS